MVYRNWWHLRLTARKDKQLACRLSREIDSHKRDDELIEVDMAVIDEL
jgi:hypothetical protein